MKKLTARQIAVKYAKEMEKQTQDYTIKVKGDKVTLRVKSS